MSYLGKRNKVVLLCLISILYFGSTITNAQNTDNNNYIPPTPNAASLGEYGRVPVSFFNGLAEISIPLGNVSEDGVSVPISLGYHGGGVKQHSFPSWVGQGWDLQAGGVITRKVNGNMDEVVVAGFSNPNLFAYYYNYSVASADNWYTASTLQSSYWPTASDLNKPIWAPQPDEFLFNFGNYSGSFFYDQTGHWQVRSKDPVHIVIKETLKTDYVLDPANHNMSGAYTLPRIFYQFILTTPDGTAYTFGGTQSSIEFSRGITGTTDLANQIIPVSWFLTKIITKNGKEIAFDYERDGINAQASPSYESFNFSGSDGNIRGAAPSSILNVSIINPCYLKSINSVDQVVYFIRSQTNQQSYRFDVGTGVRSVATGYADANGNNITKQETYSTNTVMSQMGYTDVFWPAGSSVPTSAGTLADPSLTGLYFNWLKLNAVRFYWKNGLNDPDLANDVELLKEYDFSYTDKPTSRLILNSVTESDRTGSSNPPYSFTYDPTPLPGYYPDMTDGWGYYNGKQYLSGSVFVDSKVPDANYMRAGILTGITYPTGGRTVFEYEPHDYEKIAQRYPFQVVTVPRDIAGGLRVKKITNYDASGVMVESKQYLYIKGYTPNSNGSSSGILSGIPVYTEQGSVGSVTYYRMSMYPIVPLSNTNGNHVTYSEVVEKFADGSYTIYSYSNHDMAQYMDRPALDGISGVSSGNWASSEPNVSMEIDRGKILKEQYFNSSGILLKKNEYQYDENRARESEAVRFVNVSFRNFQVNSQQPAESPLYGIIPEITSTVAFTFPQYLAQKTGTVYDQNGNNPVVTTESYIYNHLYRQLVSRSAINSKSQTTLSHLFYSYDMSAIGQDANGIYGEMIGKNIIAPVIEKRDTVGNLQTLLTRTNYNKFNSNSPFPTTSPFYYYLYLPASVEVQTGTGPVETRYLYNKYDGVGNVLEQQKPGSAMETYLWGYKARYPVAKIVGVPYDIVRQIANVDTAVLNQGDNLQTALQLMRVRGTFSNSQQAKVYTYRYRPLIGIACATDEKGDVTNFRYDGFGRLLYITDKDYKVIKQYDYHYTGQQSNNSSATYNNLTQAGVFAKNDCSHGQYPSSVTYSVPANKYSSTISQEDADDKAINDVMSNGQTYANLNGACSVNPPPVTLLLASSGTSVNTSVTISSPGGFSQSFSFPSDGQTPPVPVTLPYNQGTVYNLRFISPKSPPAYTYFVNYNYSLQPVIGNNSAWRISDGSQMNTSAFVETGNITFSSGVTYTITASQ